ncbi:MAG: hypothetical protein ACD_73C00355G0001 [uncultured bacterium]|nr:MAG: hypothetical protein ACD_73C00355G0001 [uncultured bacterium]
MVSSNGHLIFYNPTCGSQISSSSIQYNNWNHVVASRSDGRIKLYINGEVTSVASCPANLYSEGQLTFGCNSADISCAEPFNGQMDEIAAYNRSLSVDEVRRLCRAQDPTGTTCPDAHKPIILQPAPNAVLQPSRTFWSWRGERDAVGGDLYNETFDIVRSEFSPLTPKELQNIAIVPTNLKDLDGTQYYYANNFNKTYYQTFDVLSETSDDVVTFDFFDSNALWLFQNNFVEEFSSVNTFDINVGGIGFADTPAGGKGLDFENKTSKYIASSNMGIFNQSTGNFSIGIYAKLNSIGTTQALLEKRNNQSGFEFFIDQGGFLNFYVAGCPTLGSIQKSPVSTTGYHYYGVTRKSGLTAIYIDGKMVDQATCNANINSTAKMTVGCNSPEIVCQEFFHGIIDELYTSSEVFTAEAQLNQYCALQAMSVATPDEMPDVCLE